MASYSYDNIVDSDHAIRVLILSPGRQEDPLKGKLETCRLDKALAFDALSYCWGTGGKEAVIDCSGGVIQITKTLEHALRVLRHEEKPRRLWIDQICINQQDNTERSSQVRLMYEIYSLAQRTIVWLGDDENEHGPVIKRLFSDFHVMGADCRKPRFSITTLRDATNLNFMDLFHEHLKMEEEDRKMTANEKTRWFPTDDVLDQRGLPRRSSEAWPAFNALLQSHYFTRVWTLQEVLSSREAVIIWGATELPWASLRVAHRWSVLNHCFIQDPHALSDSPGLERVRFLELEFDWFRGLRYGSLVDLVTTAREQLQATDPRDQIYAFISLASDGRDFKIDYNKSETEVFRDFAKHCILQCGDLTMLNFAGLHKDEGSRLPSWVPGWRSHLLLRKSTGRDDAFIATLNEPYFPLSGENRSKIHRPRYVWKREGSLPERPDQLFIKGYRLPKDQAKIVCAHKAYSEENTKVVQIAAQFHELCHTCVSPSTFLREMVHCMTSAERRLQFDEHELLSQFISFIYNAVLLNFEFFQRPLEGLVPGLEMIGIAADAMESGVISTNPTDSRLPSTEQEGHKSLIRQAYSDRLSQEELDKMVKAISDNWNTERAVQFDASWGLTGTGRRLFVTTQGRVGIGPALMTTTDVIIFAYGGETPYVLRPVGTQEYLLLGDCYIHNLMDGTEELKEDDPFAEWFCLGGEPRQNVDTAIASSSEEAGNIG